MNEQELKKDIHRATERAINGPGQTAGDAAWYPVMPEPAKDGHTTSPRAPFDQLRDRIQTERDIAVRTADRLTIQAYNLRMQNVQLQRLSLKLELQGVREVITLLSDLGFLREL